MDRVFILFNNNNNETPFAQEIFTNVDGTWKQTQNREKLRGLEETIPKLELSTLAENNKVKLVAKPWNYKLREDAWVWLVGVMAFKDNGHSMVTVTNANETVAFSVFFDTEPSPKHIQSVLDQLDRVSQDLCGFIQGEEQQEDDNDKRKEFLSFMHRFWKRGCSTVSCLRLGASRATNRIPVTRGRASSI